MNLDQLQIIEIINETGSLTSAAKKLLRSPSAISLNLKNLEEEWQVKIFDRSQYRLKLTREGEEVLNRVKSILSETRSLEEYIKTLGNGPEAAIRISIDKIFPFQRIESLIKDLKFKFPETHLYITVESKLTPFEKLHSKEIDLAITFERDVKDPTLETIPVYTVNMLPVASPTLIKSSNIKAKELETKTQIIVGEYKKEDIGKAGIQAGESKWSVTDLATKKRLLTQGLGYGYMPLYLIEEELESGELIEIKIMRKGKAPFCLAKNKNTPMGPVKSFIWDSIKSIKQ
ncbi:hypothetical protein A9Q84_11230 [Halobacteriovorax marinus]|uniref:HTH lysR-type domain-containing protein n=1 Tax=Halobacteriovorax marinus TaxID=97084 RepID=A0A1Y5FBR8_9BACT|nr:hypothetical protein A9Q84_11230 [Halobacteriovorax marinus]